MFNIIPPLRVISVIAVTYAFLVAIALFFYMLWVPGVTLWSAIRVALSGAFALDIVLLAAVHLLWKRLWAIFPSLNTLLFPDLNGRWQMRIHWIGANDSGSVNATATIKQDFLRISMEVKSEKSDSETMMAKPKKDPESGRPVLYYVYRVVPKQTSAYAGPSYEGAAILKFDTAQIDSLAGNYFTSRKTTGHFELTRE